MTACKKSYHVISAILYVWAEFLICTTTILLEGINMIQFYWNECGLTLIDIAHKYRTQVYDYCWTGEFWCVNAPPLFILLLRYSFHSCHFWNGISVLLKAIPQSQSKIQKYLSQMKRIFSDLLLTTCEANCLHLAVSLSLWESAFSFTWSGSYAIPWLSDWNLGEK